MQDNIVNIEESINNKYKNIKFECNIEGSKNPKIKSRVSFAIIYGRHQYEMLLYFP